MTKPTETASFRKPSVTLGTHTHEMPHIPLHISKITKYKNKARETKKPKKRKGQIGK